jgi:hypothetical protein
MWLGLLYLPSADGDEIILCAWESGRERPFTIAGSLSALPEMARALRDATMRGSAPLIPRCDCCLTTLDLPLL